MTFPTSAVVFGLSNVLIPIATLVFASGFFPYKPFLPGLASHGEFEPPSAPFNKVIFMVVDALRSDFVYSHSSHFTYTQSLISSGAAIPFTAHATSPTITMPRVKAMTTGSIPSFLDVILNFAESDTSSSLAGQDSWLAQMRALNKGSLLMYGDDTWLKLFPGFFSRKDGTSSFFVSDFTEVDKNVTRHYPAELLRSDWNTLIMHYLGLDHIGHKAGPRSPNMPPKQAEMDQIVRDIYHALESQVHLQSTLFVLCGDHGMNDAGNHGGSAPGETSPALVFISPKLKEVSDGVECPTEAEDGFNFYTTIEQSDLVPTLAGLLGFPVPMNNLGVFIPSFLTFWKNDSDRLDLLFKNSQQILELVKATFPSVTFDGPIDPAKCTNPSSDLDNLACRWGKVAQFMDSRRHHQNNGAAESMANLTEFSKLAQEIMSSTASSYNLLRLKAGIAITAMATCLAATALVGVLSEKSVGLSLVTIALTYGGMMFASSYVEEEQHFWYWSASSCVAYICIKELRTTTQNKSLPGWKSLAVLVALRLYRRWNQTGQKHAGEVDIARSFFPKHSLILWLAVIATYIYIALRVTGRNFRLVSFGSTIAFSVLLSLTALWFKMAFTFADAPELFGGLPQIFLKQLTSEYLLTQARVIFLGLSLAATYTAIFEIDRLRTSRLRTPPAGTWTLHYVLTLFLMTQSRAANIPLYLLFESQLYFLRRLDLSSIEISMTSIISQYMSFFAFGGSNSISSVDLSNAYNGVSGYSVVAVGVLTFVSNWAAPIWWASATNILLVAKRNAGGNGILLQHLSSLTLFVAISLLCVMAACTALRNHLFIWTVFSPKYLYSMVWCLAQHLIINVSCGSIFFFIGTR